MTRVSFTVPLKTGLGLNDREHWAVRAKRVKAERKAVAYRWPRVDIAPIITITLTRISRNESDDDGLRGSLKGVRDAIAAKLRVDDATRLIKWDYAQERGPVAQVRIDMELPTR